MRTGVHDVTNAHLILDSDNVVGIKKSEADLSTNKKIDYINSLIDKIEIDLPSKEDLNSLIKAWESNSSYSFYKVTDLALLTGNIPSFDYFFLRETHDDDNCSLLFGTRFGKVSDGPTISEDNPINNNRFNRKMLIRPVLSFKNCPELFDQLDFPRTDANGKELKYSLVQFGWEPQNIVRRNTKRRLDELDKQGLLKTSEEQYTYDNVYAHHKENAKKDFIPMKHPVYVTSDNQKFLHWKITQCPDSRSNIDRVLFIKNYEHLNLSDNGNYQNGQYIWLEISEVQWIVDIERKTLIAKEGLLAGIQFEKYNKALGPVDYNNSNVKHYLETYMKKELLRNAHTYFMDKAICDTNSQKSQENIKPKGNTEITRLLDQIKEYKEYYYGDVDIDKTVKELLINYNDALDKAMNNIDAKNIDLPIGFVTPQYLHQQLVLKLEMILQDIRSYCIKIKDYHEMIGILVECSKDDVNKDKDSLCEIIYQCKSLIIPTVINNDIKKELTLELNTIIQKNLNYLKAIINKFKETGEVEIIPIEILKEKFRKDLNPFLIKLNNIIKNQDVVQEILNNIKLKINDYHTETQKRNLSTLQSIIDKTIEEIIKYGTQEDLNKVNAIINESEIEVSTSDIQNKDKLDLKENYHDIVHKIILKCARIIKIKLNIEERKRQIEEIEDLKVDVSFLNNGFIEEETFQK